MYRIVRKEAHDEYNKNTLENGICYKEWLREQ